MAVSNDQAPNLSGAYGNIIDSLKQRANMESGRANIFDVGTKVVDRADKEITKARDFAQQQAAAGKVLVSDDKIKELTDKLNEQLPDGKKVTARDFSSYKNTWQTTEALQNKAEQTLFASTFQDPQKALAVEISPKEGTNAVLNPQQPNVSPEEALTQEYLKSDKSPAAREKFISDVEKLKSASATAAAGKPQRSKDNFGRDTLTYPDGTVKVLNGAPKSTPMGESAKEQSQLHPAELKNFQDNLKQFNTKTVAESKKTFNELEKLEQSVKNNNPVSFFNNKVELVRLGGISAGRIAQGEIVQEAGARDFLSQAQQKIQTLTQGDWTPANRKLIQDYIASLKKVEQEHIGNQLQESVDQTVSSFPDPSRIDPEFIKKEFSKPISKYLGNDDLVNVVNPQGITGTIKRSKLDAAQKAGYKLAP